VIGPALLHETQAAGVAQAAEGDGDVAGVQRPAQLVAIAAVGLRGHLRGAEGRARGHAVDHPHHELGRLDVFADEIAVFVHLLLDRRRRRRCLSGQLRRGESRRLERLEVLGHPFQPREMDGALLAMLHLLLGVVIRLLAMEGDPLLVAPLVTLGPPCAPPFLGKKGAQECNELEIS